MSLRAARWLVALLLLSGASAQAGLRLQLDASGLSSAERQASQALLDQASAALPPSFIQRLDRQKGKVEPYVTGPGGSIRPTPSPDEILRTMKLELRPRLRLAITTPS